MKPLSEVAPGLLVIQIPIQAVCNGDCGSGGLPPLFSLDKVILLYTSVSVLFYIPPTFRGGVVGGRGEGLF